MTWNWNLKSFFFFWPWNQNQFQFLPRNWNLITPGEKVSWAQGSYNIDPPMNDQCYISYKVWRPWRVFMILKIFVSS